MTCYKHIIYSVQRAIVAPSVEMVQQSKYHYHEYDKNGGLLPRAGP